MNIVMVFKHFHIPYHLFPTITLTFTSSNLRLPFKKVFTLNLQKSPYSHGLTNYTIVSPLL